MVQRRPWWLLASSLLLLVATFRLSNAALDPIEKDALLTIKSEWALKGNAFTWVVSSDPCLNSWAGITCDALGSHVITLNLTGMGVDGNMPEAFRKLTFLQNLDASNKNYVVDVTTVAGDLAPLSSLAGSLKSLNISGNLRGGQFPDVIFNLTNLVELTIDLCNFQGYPQLSPKIGNLQKLQTLYLGENNITGSPPAELWTLRGLRELSLASNNLSSEIPAAIGNLVNLEVFNVHDCNLWGGIPSEIGVLTRMRVLRLYINTLTGRIPDSMQSMTNLTDLRLHQNYFSGDIPQWLWSFTKITNLQIEKNALTGSYPASLSPSITNLQLDCNYLTGPSLPVIPPMFTNRTWDVDENCFPTQPPARKPTQCRFPASDTLCDQFLSSFANGACPPCPENQQPNNIALCTCKPKGPVQDSETNTAAIVGGVVGAAAGVLIIVGIVLGFLWKRKKDRAKLMGRFDLQLAEELYDPNWQAPPGVQRYKLSELSNATGGFDEAHEIGVGGFGKVFVGKFKDGRTLAIKRASGLVSSTQGLAEFRNEVLLLSRLHHKNLVRLEGFCDESGMQILVYEFMRQGNLHAHLFRPESSKRHLSWYNRLEIAVGVAHGLEYLHSYADPPVIHRDVKPSNILLDDNLLAKVADFGISRATDELATHVSTRPAGTAGYFDPQYFIRQQLTTASDVYGYGVVLLELVTGQRAIDRERVSEFNLVEWVRPRLAGGIEAIADPKLGDDYPMDVFQAMAELGMECANFDKDSRPTMKEVVNILEPHLHNCVKPPPSAHDYSSTWESMEADFPTKGSSTTSLTAASTSSNFDTTGSDKKKMASSLLQKPALPLPR